MNTISPPAPNEALRRGFEALAKRHPEDRDSTEAAVVSLAKRFTRKALTEEMWFLQGFLVSHPDDVVMRRQLDLVTRARKRYFMPLGRRWDVE